jgi:GNAT superfamily N-acetyltransferase
MSCRMTALLTLRPSTAADIAALDVLLARSYPRLLAPDYPAPVHALAIPLISRARPELPACGSCWLDLDPQGGILGAGGWTQGAPGVPEDGYGRATGHIRQFGTDARLTRQGVGRALMDRVLTQAGAAGMRRLDGRATRTAVPFCAALGFQEQGGVDVPLRPGIVFPGIRMLRLLQTRVRQTERAGLSTGPLHPCPFRRRHSLLPVKFSMNMNMLMKSRYSCSAPMIAALPSQSLSLACACSR